MSVNTVKILKRRIAWEISRGKKKKKNTNTYKRARNQNHSAKPEETEK